MNYSLKFGGTCSILVAVIHAAAIFAGADWYRFFGAGEQIAIMIEEGSWLPHLMSLAISAIFTLSGLYAYSAAKVIPRLPFVRTVVATAGVMYMIRGLAPFAYLVFKPSVLSTFDLVTAVVSLIIGCAYLIGIIRPWQELKLIPLSK